MTRTDLVFASTALRELYFISKYPKEKINVWIFEHKYSVDEIASFLDSMTIEKRMHGIHFGGIDRRTATEMLNREIVAFNCYFPEKAVGGINHKIAAFRLLAGMTQAEMAEKLGVSIPRISEFENRVKFSGFEKLEEMMKVLGLTISKMHDSH